MLRNLLLIFCLLILSNCSAPGTALLGPTFTGVKTGSVAQASLSYSTGRIMNEIVELKIDSLFKNKNIKNLDIAKVPNILNTYAVKKIKISEILEPEPLP